MLFRSLRRYSELNDGGRRRSWFFPLSHGESGGESSAESEERKTEKVAGRYSEYCENEIWPQCINMGFTEKEFNDLTPRELRPYIRARELKEDRDNRFNWILGKYVMEAVVAAIDGAMHGKNSKAEYPDEPYRLRPYTEEEKAEIVQRERERAIAFFNSMETRAKANAE